MRNAEITADGTVQVVERPAPQAAGDLVVVDILVAPMCTEFKQRQHAQASDVVGHEAAGVVRDAGTSRRVKAGDRVVVMPGNACGLCWLCQAGEHIHCPNQRDVLTESGSAFGVATYTEQIIKPDWLLVPVPDDIDLRLAALACCGLGPTFNAHQRMGTTALDVVLVSGCGPVGMGGIIQAVARGARVIALEVSDYRADLARQLGAEVVLDPRAPDVPERVAALTGGRGADIAIETSGAPGAPATLARSLRRRGRMAVVAWGADINLPPLVPLGIDVLGVWHWNHQQDAEAMWRTVRRSEHLLRQQVTHEFALDEVSAAMDLQDTGACGKVFLLPDPERSLA